MSLWHALQMPSYALMEAQWAGWDRIASLRNARPHKANAIMTTAPGIMSHRTRMSARRCFSSAWSRENPSLMSAGAGAGQGKIQQQGSTAPTTKGKLMRAFSSTSLYADGLTRKRYSALSIRARRLSATAALRAWTTKYCSGPKVNVLNKNSKSKLLLNYSKNGQGIILLTHNLYVFRRRQLQ
jgi:hypothetical protein